MSSWIETNKQLKQLKQLKHNLKCHLKISILSALPANHHHPLSDNHRHPLPARNLPSATILHLVSDTAQE